jgi:hypothetical protein
MKSYKNMRKKKNISRKHKKGGFFSSLFSSKPKVAPTNTYQSVNVNPSVNGSPTVNGSPSVSSSSVDCNVNNLSQLTKIPDPYERDENGQVIYETEKDSEGNTKYDETGNIVYILDKNGNKQPVLKSNNERIEDIEQMRSKLNKQYLKCCPRGFMGRYNSSPYCKQLRKSGEEMGQYQYDISGDHTDETNVAQIKQNVGMEKPKRWGLFGGKKSRKHRRHKKHNNKTRSHRRR